MTKLLKVSIPIKLTKMKIDKRSKFLAPFLFERELPVPLHPLGQDKHPAPVVLVGTSTYFISSFKAVTNAVRKLSRGFSIP